MSQKQVVFAALADAGIPYELIEHPAAFTIEDMREFSFPKNARIAKNLFLRDAKGRRHFLVVVDTDRTADIRWLEQAIGSTRLSFASEERLQKHLKLTKGAVSPLGLINDSEQSVEVFLDKKLQAFGLIGVHPNDNTATVLVTFDDLCKFIAGTGHKVTVIEFPD
jgi:Ala-tRNA(Pro) deacylase